MSAEAEEVDPEEGDPEEESEELPEVSDDSTPDLDAINETIADETEEEEEEDDDESDDSESSEAETTSSSQPSLDGIEDFGDAYVTGLTTVSNAAVERYGDGETEPVSEDLARDLELDKAVNDWMAEHGATDEMSPMQAMLTMTVVFIAIVMMSNPALVEKIIDSIAGGDDV